MPIFEAEMFRRVWWCTYILDRRLAIDTGRPFLVQDVNTDVPVPLELGEAWLSHHRNTRLTSNQLKKEIEIEIRRNITTPLPHIAAMVDYSRVVGKVWEAHYGAFDQQSISAPLTTEYLEFLVSSTDIKRAVEGMVRLERAVPCAVCWDGMVANQAKNAHAYCMLRESPARSLPH